VEQLGTSHWFDTTAAERDFGYVPEISIEQGLARLACWRPPRGRSDHSNST